MKLVGIYILLLVPFVGHFEIGGRGELSSSVQKIEFKDRRLVTAITDYIRVEELNGVPGAVVLQYQRGTTDVFYLGYIVYQTNQHECPPSYYTILSKKLILVYTGFERYLEVSTESLNSFIRETKLFFPPDGGVAVEPIYWKVEFNGDTYKREIVDKFPLH